MAGGAGFYSGKTGRSYFYDNISENNGQYRQTKEKLLAEQRKLDEFRGSVEAQDDPGVVYVFRENNGQEVRLGREGALRRLDAQENLLRGEVDRLREFYRKQNITVTIHEGTHQLAYNCGSHSRYFYNPLWLVEEYVIGPTNPPVSRSFILSRPDTTVSIFKSFPANSTPL